MFTSGGTESDNFALAGRRRGARADRPPAPHRQQHRARGRARSRCEALARRGWRTTLLPVGQPGIVDPAALARRARPTIRRSCRVMHANNEIGTIQPIAELARHRARARRALSHRRRPVDREDSRRRSRARRGSAVAVRSQVQRTERGRRAVDQARRARHRDPDRRQARAQPARRDRERAGASPGSGVAARLAAREAGRRGGAARRRCATGSRKPSWRRCPGRRSMASASRACRTPRTSASTRSRPRVLLIALDLEGVAVSTGSACSSGHARAVARAPRDGAALAAHTELDPLEPRRR